MTANRFEVVGPAGRASGRKIDLRKTHPYLLYKDIPYDLPITHTGDVLGRARIRIEEAFASFSMINHLIDTIEEGPVKADIQLNNVQPYTPALGWTESAMGENVHWIMADESGHIFRYRIRSAAYHNWPAVPTAVQGNIVPDFPIINKSFELCYACCDR